MAPAAGPRRRQKTSRRALLVAVSGVSAGTAAAFANVFLTTLTETQRETVLFDWGDTAQKQRWSNFPQGLFDRAGLMWGDPGALPREAWLALMRATLSAEGYHRVIGQWHADDALAQDDSGGAVGRG